MAFRLVSVGLDGQKIQLVSEKRVVKSSNHITVIIGKNGTGKSQILSGIILNLAHVYHQFNKNGVRESRLAVPYQAHVDNICISRDGLKGTIRNQRLVGLDAPVAERVLPQHIIASTSSPFDKFPTYNEFNSKGIEENAKSFGYTYLGVRDQLGEGVQSRVFQCAINSLVLRRDRTNYEKMASAFAFIKLKPRIEIIVDYLMDVNFYKNIALNGDSSDISDYLASKSRKFYLPGRFATNSHVKRVKNALDKSISRYDTRRRLRFVLNLNAAKTLGGILDEIKELIPLLEAGVVKLSSMKIESDSGVRFDVFQASSGEQAMIATILGIAGHIEDNSLVCIDEPELGLHPEWQERYVDLLLHTFSEYRGCHFIIATHSPQIVSKMSGTHSTVVRLEKGKCEILDGASLYGRSVDFQLASVFGSPGQGNEYLIRIALTAMAKWNKGEKDDDFRCALEALGRVHPFLSKNDPVSVLCESLYKMIGYTHEN